jgi:hypothetical protein
MGQLDDTVKPRDSSLYMLAEGEERLKKRRSMIR